MKKQILLKKISESLEEIRSKINTEKRNFDTAIHRLVVKNPASTALFLNNISGRLVEIEKEIGVYSNDLPAMWEKWFPDVTEEPHDLYSDERIEIYRAINARLVVIEKETRINFGRISEFCKSMLDEGAIEDYEIGVEVSFWLNEKDPEYIDEDDNILATLTFNGKFDEINMLGDGINHNDFQSQTHPLRNEHHCYLFRCLYHRTDLWWEEISRIDMVWVDINVRYQRFHKIQDNAEYAV